MPLSRPLFESLAVNSSVRDTLQGSPIVWRVAEGVGFEPTVGF